MKKTGKSSSMAEFEALLNEQFSTFRKGFNPGERVSARVMAVNSSYVVIDVKAKKEGLIPREEFLDEAGNLTVKPGDTVDVLFVAQDGGALIFAAHDASASVDRSIQQAYEAQLPVEGKVAAEINGGYEVTVGSTRAFCPYSQIDLHKQEGAVYVGRTMEFLVQEYDPEAKNLVVSRRAFLERERDRQREELREGLVAGTTRTGKVTRITDFGFFVELGGAEGLVPMKELSWQRNVKPSDVVSVGQTVEVYVREVDWERNRISLSLRATQPNPLDAFLTSCEVGATMTGKVTRLEPFGAFVELEPGVEGLLPIGALGKGRRIGHPSQVLSLGQSLEVRIDSVDIDLRRISLRPVPTAAEIEAAEKARAEWEAKHRRPDEVDDAEEEGFDLKQALADFRKNNDDKGSFSSLGDAFAKLDL